MLNFNVWTPNGNNSHINKNNSHFSFSHNYNYQYSIPTKKREKSKHSLPTPPSTKPKILCNSVKLNLIRTKRKKTKKFKCFVNNLFVHHIDIFFLSSFSVLIVAYASSFRFIRLYRNDMLERTFGTDSTWIYHKWKKKLKQPSPNNLIFSFRNSVCFFFSFLQFVRFVLVFAMARWLLARWGVCQSCF